MTGGALVRWCGGVVVVVWWWWRYGGVEVWWYGGEKVWCGGVVDPLASVCKTPLSLFGRGGAGDRLPPCLFFQLFSLLLVEISRIKSVFINIT